MFWRPSTLLRATLLLSLAASALFVTACDDALWGNGRATTVSRDIPAFDAIALEVPLELRIELVTDDPEAPPTRGPRDTTLASLRCDSNLVHHIETEVERGTLRVRNSEPRFDLRPDTDCELHVTTAHLESITIHGPGELVVDGVLAELRHIAIEGPAELDAHGIAVDTLELHVEGPAELSLSGSVVRLVADLEGPVELGAEDLVAAVVVLVAEGPVEADVRAEDSCVLDIEGPAVIDVHGDPGLRDVDSEGPAEIHFR